MVYFVRARAGSTVAREREVAVLPVSTFLKAFNNEVSRFADGRASPKIRRRIILQASDCWCIGASVTTSYHILRDR